MADKVYSTLRDANIARQAAWCPEQIPDLSFRGCELAGEVGEALNVIKKLERERLGWRGSRDTVEHLAEELADVVICADLVALSAGIDLEAAVVAKFNATSEKVGLPHRLAARTGDVEKAVDVALKHWFKGPHHTDLCEFEGTDRDDMRATLLAAFHHMPQQQSMIDLIDDYGDHHHGCDQAQPNCSCGFRQRYRTALKGETDRG